MILDRIYFKMVCIIIIFFVSALDIRAQGDADKFFKYIRIVKVPNHARSKVEFYDSVSNQLVKTIDAVELNPFGRFDAKISGRLEYEGTPIYELDTMKQIRYLNSIELVSENNHFAASKLQPFNLLSFYTVSLQGRNYVAILYELATLNKAGRNISSHSTILIFDREGNFVKQSPIWDINGDRPVISDDGWFVLFKSGGPYGWEQQGYLPNRLIVYDTKHNTRFIDSDVDLGCSTDLIAGKYFNTSIFNSDRITDVIIYDFYENNKYKRKLSFEEMPSIHSVNSQGFLFSKSSGEVYLKYSFENDFIKSKITFENEK